MSEWVNMAFIHVWQNSEISATHLAALCNPESGVWNALKSDSDGTGAALWWAAAGQRHSTQITTSEYPQDACEVVYETEWILCLHFRKSWWYSVSYNTNIPTPNAWNLKCFQSQRFQIKVSQTMYFQSPNKHSVSCLRSLQNCHIHKPSIETIFPSLWRELCVCSPALILPSVSLLPLLPFYRLLNLGPG